MSREWHGKRGAGMCANVIKIDSHLYLGILREGFSTLSLNTLGNLNVRCECLSYLETSLSALSNN